SFSRKPLSYGIPILSPFPNCLRDGRLTFHVQTFEINPPRHGFVRDKPWRVLASGASDEAGAWLTAGFDARDYPEQILAQFPFPYLLVVTYCLSEGALTMATVAANTGVADMSVVHDVDPYLNRSGRGAFVVSADASAE